MLLSIELTVLMCFFSEIPSRYEVMYSVRLEQWSRLMKQLSKAQISQEGDQSIQYDIIPKKIHQFKARHKVPGLMIMNRDTLNPEKTAADYFCIKWNWPGTYQYVLFDHLSAK